MEERYRDLLKSLANELNNEVLEYERQANSEELVLAQLHKEDEQMVKHVHDISVHEIDLSSTKPTLFPLRDNMVFGHAIQLAFDSSISDFIIEAQKLEESDLPLELKRKHLVRTMRKVLPIIKRYIQILMGITNKVLPTQFSERAYRPGALEKSISI